MRFEEALKAMRKGKKVKSSTIIYPLYIADYTNGFNETYKAICYDYGVGSPLYYNINHRNIFAEDWEVVEE